jgi:hypothetical protein
MAGEGVPVFSEALMNAIVRYLPALREALDDYEREELELKHEQERKRTEEECWAWAMPPENRDRICQGHLCREERRRRLRAFFGRLPGEPRPGADAAAPSNHGESSPIKPEQALPPDPEASPQAQSKAGERSQSPCD